MAEFARYAKKAVVGGLGFLAAALAAGLLDGTAEVVGFAVVAVAAEYGIYQARNKPRPTDPLTAGGPPVV